MHDMLNCVNLNGSFHLTRGKKGGTDERKLSRTSKVLFSIVFCFWGLGLVLLGKGKFSLISGAGSPALPWQKDAQAKPIFLEFQPFLPITKYGLGNSHHPGFFQKTPFPLVNHILKQGEEMMKKFSSCSQDTVIACMGPWVGIGITCGHSRVFSGYLCLCLLLVRI